MLQKATGSAGFHCYFIN
uniref:Uncharacterized protein n=1 Tax=Anguilla anguilla TaxID=7936 RepID=A0A0E9XSH8_ANGAN